MRALNPIVLTIQSINADRKRALCFCFSSRLLGLFLHSVVHARRRSHVMMALVSGGCGAVDDDSLFGN